MIAPTHGTRAVIRIERSSATAALEFKAFGFPLIGPATTELPDRPGAVERDVSGRATLLHFAPGRFLAPAPTAETARHLAALADAGVGASFDVEGKWQEFALSGSSAERVLAATIDARAVLGQRDCAAVQLFDCPCVLARRKDGYDVWVEASYALDLGESFARVGKEL